MEAPRRPRPFVNVQEPIPQAPKIESLSLAELFSFFKNPAAAWASELGIWSASGGDAQDADEDPLGPLEALSAWAVREAALKDALRDPKGAKVERLIQRLVADRTLSYGALGRAQARQAMAGARQAMAGVLAAGGTQRRYFEAALPTRLGGDLDELADASALVLLTGSNINSAKVMLRSWLAVALAAAAGEPLELCVVAAGAQNEIAAFQFGSEKRAVAKKALAGLLALRQAGLSEPLPFQVDFSCQLAQEARLAESEKRPPNFEPLLDAESLLAGDSALALAWRDRDPFAGAGLGAWVKLARQVWDPVLAWVDDNQEDAP